MHDWVSWGFIRFHFSITVLFNIELFRKSSFIKKNRRNCCDDFLHLRQFSIVINLKENQTHGNVFLWKKNILKNIYNFVLEHRVKRQNWIWWGKNIQVFWADSQFLFIAKFWKQIIIERSDNRNENKQKNVYLQLIKNEKDNKLMHHRG